MRFAPFILVVTLRDVLGAPLYKNLMARAGGEITLQTGLTELQGDYLVWWRSNTSNDTLVYWDKEEKMFHAKRFEGRLHLDTTGCLTIRNLSIEDDGIYLGEVIDGNNKRTVYNYTVTVLEAAGSSFNTAAAQRNHLAAVVSVLLSVAVCIVLFAVSRKTGGNCCPTACHLPNTVV